MPGREVVYLDTASLCTVDGAPSEECICLHLSVFSSYNPRQRPGLRTLVAGAAMMTVMMMAAMTAMGLKMCVALGTLGQR